MKREYAERVNEYYLCPLCLYGSSEWDEIVDHLEKNHTDEEAVEQLGLDPIPPTREEDPGWWFDRERKEREEEEAIERAQRLEDEEETAMCTEAYEKAHFGSG